MKRLLPGLFLILPAVAENPLAVALVSEAKVVAPGETFMIGLHLKPPAGSHIYWKHPGIVGLATTVAWDLPPGFKAGEIQWPAPQMVKMARYTAQGYDGETLLMVPITASDSPGPSPLQLTARLSWMCCGERCQPASDVPFSITLPVSSQGTPDPSNRPLFESFQAKVPQPDEAWTSTVERGEKTIILTLKPTDPDVTRDVADLGKLRFFTADGQVDSDGEQKVTVGPGQVIRMELPVSESGPAAIEGLPGVIVAEKSWRKSGGPLGLEVK